MITGNGKIHIKRYLAGFVPNVVQSIAYGIGTRATAGADNRLQFETGRVNLSLTTVDMAANKIIYKAQLPEYEAGRIYEVGIYSVPADMVAGEFGSRLISSFDSDSEEWTNTSDGSPAFYSNTFSRIGEDSLRHTPGASTAQTSTLTQLSMDLEGYSGSDRFVLAFNVGNENTAGITVRFMTDSSNYYDFNMGAQTTGYKFAEWQKADAVVTGSPNWATITQIQVITTATAAGPAQVDFDGIRVEDIDTVNPEYVMISREVLGTPYIKQEGRIQEVEFALVINL